MAGQVGGLSSLVVDGERPGEHDQIESRSATKVDQDRRRADDHAIHVRTDVAIGLERASKFSSEGLVA